jgi:curved DNA-binding protein CbpA
VKPLGEQTLYEILDVPPGAPPAEIERACERAMALYGAGSIVTYTLMSSEEANQLAARIEEARRTLLDEATRASYDESLGLASAKPAAPPEARAAPVETVAGAARAEGEGAPAPAAAPGSPGAPAPPAPLPLTTVATGSAAPATAPAPIPLRMEAARPAERDVVVAEDAAWSGEVLRRVREARGISIQQISERTRVVRHHVENIEADRFGLLPAPVYLRGILQAIARELRLDPQKVSRSYLERLQASGVSPAPPPARSR